MGWNQYTQALWLRVGVAAFFQALAGGLVTGFAGLKPALLEHGAYHGLCSDDVPSDQSCDEQVIALNRLAVIGTAGVCLFTFPMGVWNDRLQNPRLFFLIGIISTSIFIALFGLCLLPGVPLTVQIYILPFFYTGLGVTGIIVFLSLLSFMQKPPSRDDREAGYINALITGSWDLSSGIFWLLALLYLNTNFELDLIFVIYGLALILPGIIYYFFFRLPTFSLNSNDEALLDGHSDYDEREVQSPSFESTDSILNEQPSTFIEFIKTPLAYVLWICTCSYMASGYWYIATYLEQLHWILNTTDDTDEIDRFNNLFSVALPVIGFGSNIFQGYLLSKFPPYMRWIFLAILSLILGTFTCITIIEIQYIICIIFPFWRMFGVVQIYNHVGTYFPPQMFGKISFGGFALSGVFNFLNLYLNWGTINQWDGNYMYVNAAYTFINTVGSLWAAYITFKAN